MQHVKVVSIPKKSRHFWLKNAFSMPGYWTCDLGVEKRSVAKFFNTQIAGKAFSPKKLL